MPEPGEALWPVQPEPQLGGVVPVDAADVDVDAVPLFDAVPVAPVPVVAVPGDAAVASTAR